MKKAVMSLSALLVLLSLPAVVFAQGKQQGQGVQQRVQEPSTQEDEAAAAPQGSQVQNQNQVQTQNQGEDQQLQITTREQENLQTGQSKSVNPRSENARQHMSIVAQEVENLLTTGSRMGGIGQQVREVAQQQKQAQTQIQQQLGKLESRQGLMKKLFGTDYKAIKNLNQQVERSRLRIQQLQELEPQLANQIDQTRIAQVIQALTEQNTALQEQVQAEEQTASLLGWLFKLLAR